MYIEIQISNELDITGITKDGGSYEKYHLDDKQISGTVIRLEQFSLLKTYQGSVFRHCKHYPGCWVFCWRALNNFTLKIDAESFELNEVVYEDETVADVESQHITEDPLKDIELHLLNPFSILVFKNENGDDKSAIVDRDGNTWIEQ